VGQLVVYGLLAIVLAGALFVLASRFLPAGEQIAPPLRDEPPWELPPERMLDPDEVDAIRLPVALRGYRFAETDILIDRLAGELRSRDREITRLRGQRAPAPTARPSFEKPQEAAVDTASTPEPSTTPAGSWAPPPGPDADAPQPPPLDGDEQPVTATPDETPAVPPAVRPDHDRR
jgi:hypothetical protein